MEKRIRFRSDVKVELVQSMGDDISVVESARVSTKGSDATGKKPEGSNIRLFDPHNGIDIRMPNTKERGLINFLMRDRHGTPFEHNAFTFYVEAPIFVFREFMRHRIASYNEESGRYKQLDPVFYVPGRNRKLLQEGKPGAYEYKTGLIYHHLTVEEQTMNAATKAYEAYEKMLESGVAREVARGVLPVNIYSSMFVTMNARGLMNFLSLRVDSPQNSFPSYPQREIEMVAEKMEKLWADRMPTTAELFVEHGRVAP